MIKPTSKATLKRECLYLCHLDVDKAEKMYNFLVKDMTQLPDVEPEQRPFIQNFGKQAGDVLSWFRKNQDMLAQGADLLRGIFGKKVPASPLPPINE